MGLTELNKISILEVSFYSPALLLGILLSYRHGFTRSSGWIFLVILSLIRVIGAALQLATIQSPDNWNLYIGAQVLQNIGLSPLVLVSFGLVTRAYLAIQPENLRPSVPNTRILSLLQLLVLIGLGLTTAGGSITGGDIGDDIANGETTFTYTVSPLSKAGISCIAASFILLVLLTLLLAASHLTNIPRGERRLLGAVAAATPFVLVRLIYSLMSVFTTDDNFRSYSNGTHYADYLLGMGVIMEIIAVIIVESVGLTLPYTPRSQRGTSNNSADTDNDACQADGYELRKPSSRSDMTESV